MTPKIIRLDRSLFPAYVQANLAGNPLDRSHTHSDTILANQAVRVFKPDGTFLLELLPRHIPVEVGKAAFSHLRGKVPNRSTTRFPTIQDALLPLATAALSTPQDAAIIHRNHVTPVQRLSGSPGLAFAAMAYLSAGKVDGGLICFPAYRIAIQLNSLDLLYFDAREYYAITPVNGKPNSYETIQTIFYDAASKAPSKVSVEPCKGGDVDCGDCAECDEFGLPIVRLSQYMPDTDAWIGTKLTDADYDAHRLITQSCRVYDPFGDLLIVAVKNAIPVNIARKTFKVLEGHVGKKSFGGARNNRGSATGKTESGSVSPDGALLKRGERTRTHFNPEQVKSGIIGYFNREVRHPFCRETAFLQHHPQDWQALQPFINTVDRLYAKYAPDAYARQRTFCDQVNPAWMIGDTVFSTITLNADWQTAAHRDAGDYAGGIGVMACLRAGHYTGGRLVLPRYRVAIEVESRDLILFNVHQVHGNTPIVGKPGQFRRITTVFYVREKMVHCGSPQEEVDRAKNRRMGDPLN